MTQLDKALLDFTSASCAGISDDEHRARLAALRKAM